MKSLSPALASLANVFKIPMSMAPVRPSISRACHETLNRQTQQPGPVTAALQSAPFSTTSVMAARKTNNGPVIDKRITLIRYFLHHPLTPRPLRFSRNRYLRHWTIHRAWQLFQAQQRRKHELEMMRQYQSMQDACEELRTGAGDGGKLFRVSMNKKGIFTDMFPIEYARMQTESPPSGGWNYDWKKPGKK
ncbi:Ribosomal protein L28/L40 mitochondrial [Penicillium cf. griseofulvum]|uniref:Large ribosomal subunit protein mL40 n=1 Tax=Penicillium cf. griseofulvum TaxID=2972120 RepID=A0A9W9J1A0_9EURO|nr:Ribosomal protein L28/L40 mitochondrial [Penicillium cf. griseofulvum]KAJ5434266.1 Ribosomal protein L28/L40 mitochondrial [Penicillium cf. griseofulvum]KAJ5452096.1 Ribosomal protein L28/L40 mitochondrial [Penicillium cf. griseofulvum]